MRTVPLNSITLAPEMGVTSSGQLVEKHEKIKHDHRIQGHTTDVNSPFNVYFLDIPKRLDKEIGRN